MSERVPESSRIVPDSDEARRLAREVTGTGGVLAFRTDTFYGLGADPFDTVGLSRINHLKEREGKRPVLVVISDQEVAERFIAEKTRLFEELAENYWPGALTLVCRARVEVPFGITAGSGTVGIRLPLDEDVRELVRACGGALTATSANLAGQPPARTAAEVASYFPRELDLIIDGGQARTDKPSTVIDVSGNDARLIREGEIPAEKIDSFLHRFNDSMKK